MPNDDLPGDLIHASAAGKLVGHHPSCISRWILAGYIRGWKRPGRWGRLLVSRAEVLAHARGVRVKPVIPSVRPCKVPGWVRKDLEKRGLRIGGSAS